MPESKPISNFMIVNGNNSASVTKQGGSVSTTTTGMINEYFHARKMSQEMISRSKA